MAWYPAVDVHDLAGGGREPVGEQRQAGQRRRLLSVRLQPSGARSVQFSAKLVEPGIDLAAMVAQRPGGHRLLRMPCLPGAAPGSGTPTPDRPGHAIQS